MSPYIYGTVWWGLYWTGESALFGCDYGYILTRTTIFLWLSAFNAQWFSKSPVEEFVTPWHVESEKKKVLNWNLFFPGASTCMYHIWPLRQDKVSSMKSTYFNCESDSAHIQQEESFCCSHSSPSPPSPKGGIGALLFSIPTSGPLSSSSLKLSTMDFLSSKLIIRHPSLWLSSPGPRVILSHFLILFNSWITDLLSNTISVLILGDLEIHVSDLSKNLALSYFNASLFTFVLVLPSQIMHSHGHASWTLSLPMTAIPPLSKFYPVPPHLYHLSFKVTPIIILALAILWLSHISTHWPHRFLLLFNPVLFSLLSEHKFLSNLYNLVLFIHSKIHCFITLHWQSHSPVSFVPALMSQMVADEPTRAWRVCRGETQWTLLLPDNLPRPCICPLSETDIASLHTPPTPDFPSPYFLSADHFIPYFMEIKATRG